MSRKDENEITFTCDGRKISARSGQSVAAALWAHGDRVLSRSTKYHRPRGWACGTGDCANCTMRVDGTPNVRTCVEPVQEGMQVEGQNAWPNVRHDLFRANDLVFPTGIDHHHGFVRPRMLYPLFARVIRSFAGWGRLPDEPAPEAKTETRRVDLLVAGGGPAGLAAATAAAEAGAQVLLVERQGALGGLSAWLKRPLVDPDADPPGSGKKVPGHELAARWHREVRDTGRVILHHPATLTGLYPERVHLIHAPGKISLVRAGATVFATGGLANEGLFPGNDLPGVMNAPGCLALLNREGVLPGRRVLVHGAGAHGLATALELHAAGVEVIAITEPADASSAPASLQDAIERAGIPRTMRTSIRRTHGWNRLRAVTLQSSDGRRRQKCDVLVVALGAKTLPFALQGAGARLTHDPARGGTVPVLDSRMMTSLDGFFAAGDAAGIGAIPIARASGRLAGLAAAVHLGFTPDHWKPEQSRLTRLLERQGLPIADDPENTGNGGLGSSGSRPQEVVR